MTARSVQKPGRNDRIDLVRGLALAMIFINHLPGNWLENWTSRNFGFSDAAELFVLLAGYASALAFYEQSSRGEIVSVAWKAGRRSLKLYSAHLFTTFVAAGLFAGFLRASGRPDDFDLIGVAPLLNEPVSSLFAIALGGLQLNYFNILPMYVVLLAALPGMLWLAARDLRLLAAASLGCYLATNLGGLALPSCQNCESWFFNPLAWQALFVIGLLLGIAQRRGQSIPYHWAAFGLAVGYLVFAGVWTCWSLGGTLGGRLLPHWLGSLHKSHLPVARLLHVLALAYVVCHSRVWTLLERLPRTFVLTRMGRHSLPVFMTGSLLSMTGWMVLTVAQGGVVLQTALVVGGLAVMGTLTAWLEGSLHLPLLRLETPHAGDFAPTRTLVLTR